MDIPAEPSHPDAYEAACDRLEYLASLVSMEWPDFQRQPWSGEFLLEEHRNVAARVAQELAPGRPYWRAVHSAATWPGPRPHVTNYKPGCVASPWDDLGGRHTGIEQ